jgi:hypothetical protein
LLALRCGGGRRGTGAGEAGLQAEKPAPRTKQSSDCTCTGSLIMTQSCES